MTVAEDVLTADVLDIGSGLAGNWAAAGARRFGGDCYSFGLLAAGHIDLLIAAGLQPYDYMSLVPVIEGAGGVITDGAGQALSLKSDGRVIASATDELHAATLRSLAERRTI